MTLFHWAQVALALVAAGVVARRLRTVLHGTALLGEPIVRAVRRAARQGRTEVIAELASGAMPAWIGQVLSAGVTALAEGQDVARAVDEPLSEIRYEVDRVRSLRVLARIASAVGLLGAVWEMLRLWVLPPSDLTGLVAGLPERLATQAALLSVAIGVTTSLVVLSAMSTLHRRAAACLRDARACAEALEELGAAGTDARRSGDGTGEGEP